MTSKNKIEEELKKNMKSWDGAKDKTDKHFLLWLRKPVLMTFQVFSFNSVSEKKNLKDNTLEKASMVFF